MSRPDSSGPPSESPSPRRPIPVRDLLAAEAAASPSEGRETPPEIRTIQVDGEEWTIQVTGSTRSGTGADAGAPLLFLTYSRAGAANQPEREGLAVGVLLENFSDEELSECLARSKPVQPAGPAKKKSE